MKLAILAISAVLFSACATMHTPVVNNTDLSKIDFSKVSAMKSGESCARWYFIFGPFGTESLVTAAKNGGLSKVEVVDYKQESQFFVFSRCIVAYGR